MKLIAVIGIIAFFMVGLVIPARAYEPEYNFNFVIADDDMLDYNSLTQAGIQEFLELHNSGLQSYTVSVTTDGVTTEKTAAQIIYQAAQQYQISPKFILTTLQKEEALIDDPTPPQIHLDYAMGYNCPDSSGCNPTTKGFAVQVDLGTRLFRKYLDQLARPEAPYTVTYWGPGITKQLVCLAYEVSDGFCANAGDAVDVTPANNATAALYTYTPHFHGNYIFWKIWRRYNFNLKRLYPDGSLLRAKGAPDVWLIQNGQKRRFSNSAAFLSRYSFGQVITVTTDHLLTYETGREISYANYSLLSSPPGGIYLLANDVKRPIQSRQAFNQAGYRMAEVVKVGWDILDQFPDGEPITVDNVYPSGRLMQNKKTGAVFYVKDGVRHPVISRAIYRSQFGRQRPYPVSPTELEKYPDALPVGFKDGELLTAKSGGTAYFISNGYRLPIASWQAAKAYKFDRIWKTLLVVDDASLAIHPIGPVLDVDTTQTASVSQP